MGLGLPIVWPSLPSFVKADSHARGLRVATYLHRENIMAPSNVDFAMRLRD